LRLARRAIESAGHRILSATSGEEALKIASDHPDAIDLLLTDVGMRGMTGNQLADRLAEKRPGIGIIYMSGHAERSLADPGSLPSGAHFLTKPFSSDCLLEIIRLAQSQRNSRAHRR